MRYVNERKLSIILHAYIYIYIIIIIAIITEKLTKRKVASVRSAKRT